MMINNYQSGRMPQGYRLSFVRGYIVISDPYATVLYASTCVTNKDHSFFEEMQGEVTNKIWGGEMNETFYEHMGDQLRKKKRPFIVSAERIGSYDSQVTRSVHIMPVLDASLNIKYFLEVEPEIYGKQQNGEFDREFVDLFENQRQEPLKLMKFLKRWLGLRIMNMNGYFPVEGDKNDIGDVAALLETLFLKDVDPKILRQLEDNGLLKAAKDDSYLYGEIYRRYKDIIFRYFYLRLDHDVYLAEDLMQNTFIKAYDALDRYNTNRPYLNYLLTVAHNVLIDHYRKRNSVSLNEDMASVSDDHKMEDNFAVGESVEKVWEVVRSMPRTHRMILYLKYRKDMSNKEIASKMKKSTDSVKCTIKRALKKIRNDFQLKKSNLG